MFEWWTIVKDRIGKYIHRRKLNRTRNKLGGAHLFPTTKKQLKEFVKDKQFLKNDLKRDPQQIESVSEKKLICFPKDQNYFFESFVTRK